MFDMKKTIILVIAVFCGLASFSQKINGQWRGFFDSNNDIILNGNGNSTEYVLELEINKTKVTGYSYSYFQGRKYYVICKLDGVYYPANKSIKVTETERLKGNTPPDFTDCLQVHYLTYGKEKDQEELSGSWKTAPGQRGGCGEGSTTLIRRTLSKDLASFNKPKSTIAPAPTKKAPAKPKTTPPAVAKKTPAKPKPTPPAVAKQNNVTKPKPAPLKNVAPQKTVVPPPIVKATPEKQEIPKIDNAENIKPESKVQIPLAGFEKRNTELLKTINIEHENFRVDLYDNGEVDGDSVSLFYNGKLILSHKKLSEKPITLTLDASTGRQINELTMYAENLGEIPPNTALMVVTDGDKRYEVRISSDYKKSGTIHFVHGEKTQ